MGISDNDSQAVPETGRVLRGIRKRWSANGNLSTSSMGIGADVGSEERTQHVGGLSHHSNSPVFDACPGVDDVDAWELVDQGHDLPDDRFGLDVDQVPVDWRADDHTAWDGTGEVAADDGQVVKGPEGRDMADTMFGLNKSKMARMPWERGPLAKIFDGTAASVKPVPSMPHSWSLHSIEYKLHVAGNEPESAPLASGVAAACVGPRFVKCFVARDDKTHDQIMERKHEVAVLKWLTIVSLRLLASKVGGQIINAGSAEAQKRAAPGIVSATLGIKSPETAIKHANAMLGYISFMAKFHRCHPFPFSEERVWSYLVTLVEVGSAATTADTFVRALRFSHYVFGFYGALDAFSSRRVVGLAEKQFIKKRLLKQATPLTVEQVKKLHAVLEDPQSHIGDAVCASYLIIALYSRARHSDLRSVDKVLEDFDMTGGFLEILTNKHKTGRNADKRTRLLPILAPARSIVGHVWALGALQARESAGLPRSGSILGPLLPAVKFSADGEVFSEDAFISWCKRPSLSQEVTNILRRFLEVDERSGISSHSLKATLLSWASKFGLDPETRSALGRHSSTTHGSEAVYARDLAVAPVRKLQEVIDAVANGSFAPDASRSNYFPSADKQVRMAPSGCSSEVVKIEDEPASPQAVSHEIVDDSDSGSSESDSPSDGDSSSHEDEDLKRLEAELPENIAVRKFFRHKSSRVLHEAGVGLSDGTSFLSKCGRKMSGNYEPFRPDVTAWSHRCQVCFSAIAHVSQSR